MLCTVHSQNQAMGIIAELKRRSVFKLGIAYLIVAWLLLQMVATVVPILALPEWVDKLTLLMLVIGFPIALVLAWSYELTPEGIHADVDTTSSTSASGGKLSSLVIGALALIVVYFLVDKYLLSGDRGVSSLGPEIGRSVAVLPFANLSGNESNEAFTVGIHDDLLTQVSRIGSIRAISRTSVLQYRDTTKTIPVIAKELGVATVLQGGVQRSGDRVRVNAQLINAATDDHLWVGSFDRELTAQNIFSIQSEIAIAIANALRVTLTADEQRRLANVPTENTAALETYFIGKRLLEDRTRESLQAAVEYFKKVIELDPNFALAHSGMADAYMLLPEYCAGADREEISRKSDSAVARALALDPDLPEVITSEAWNRLIHDYDWQGAEASFNRALEIQPNNSNPLHWLSHTLSWQGRHDEALEYARRAVSVDPHSSLMHMNLVYIMVDAGQYDAALALGKELQEREPEYYALRRNLWLHELRARRTEDAARTFRSWAVITKADVAAAEKVGQMFIDYNRLGLVGDLSPELIEQLNLGAEDLPHVYAFIGNRERTLAALEKAAEGRTGSRSVLSMKVNPGYDFIREDIRFKALLKKVGLGE